MTPGAALGGGNNKDGVVSLMSWNHLLSSKIMEVSALGLRSSATNVWTLTMCAGECTLVNRCWDWHDRQEVDYCIRLAT